MRQISLREFRTRGSRALGTTPQNEPILLAGQQGPAYFLVPVLGEVVTQDRELRRALAKASVRAGWTLATAPGQKPIDDEEIDSEIAKVRSIRSARKPRKSR